MKPSVNDEVIIVEVRRGGSDKIQRRQVTKVGRKYFYTSDDGPVFEVEDYGLGYWPQKTQYLPRYGAYPDMASYEREIERRTLENKIDRVDFCNLPLEQLQAIYAIIQSPSETQ
jgi:hypothetical protein